MHNWNNFLKEFTNNILPIYEKHESTFDTYKIHGRLHIARSIIFAEFMARYYHNLGVDVDCDAIRYAVAFHDAGRQGSGVDIWEKDSSKMCFLYLSNKYNADYCKYVSNLIVKELDNSDTNKKIVTDADVLEIMRPVCGHGGIFGFNSKFLSFLPEEQEIRDNLIKDAWKLINYTEDNQDMFTESNHLYQILEYLKENKTDYKVLNFNDEF